MAANLLCRHGWHKWKKMRTSKVTDTGSASVANGKATVQAVSAL
jgi:membrane-bound lytic murein transglycosylase B